MQLTISRTELARVVGAVGKVVEARNTIPILSNILLETEGDTLKVTATDLDIVVSDTAPASVQVEGRVCVDARLIGDIAKKAGGDVSLSLEGNKLVVKSGRSRFSLETRDPADFPSLADGKYDVTIDVDLASLFAPVSFAIAVKDVRPFLEGIYLHVMDGKLTAVATNGHRLARHVGGDAPGFAGVIIAQKPVSVISGIKGVAKVSINNEKVRVESEGFVMTTKLIAGDYPDYRRVIPVQNNLVASADKGDILKAAERVTVVSHQRGNAVKMSVVPGGITMTVHGAEGDAVDELPAEYNGEPVDIGFNSIYLRDALHVFPDGLVDIALSDPGSPARITSPTYPSLDVTLMPMRV
ncbi:DNA polymerase III subunit beta [Rhizobium sp.]|uniref:DNA polymerase III subunit beta n=1 Tax=Rhizobium sp. TaxID=391 RepID=UPI0028A0E817